MSICWYRLVLKFEIFPVVLLGYFLGSVRTKVTFQLITAFGLFTGEIRIEVCSLSQLAYYFFTYVVFPVEEVFSLDELLHF